MKYQNLWVKYQNFWVKYQNFWVIYRNFLLKSRNFWVKYGKFLVKYKNFWINYGYFRVKYNFFWISQFLPCYFCENVQKYPFTCLYPPPIYTIKHKKRNVCVQPHIQVIEIGGGVLAFIWGAYWPGKWQCGTAAY